MPNLIINERPVTDVPAASPGDARAHFEWLLAYETDCWDVHTALTAGHGGFIVLDVRSPEAFAAGHVPGAVNLPYMQNLDSSGRFRPRRKPRGSKCRESFRINSMPGLRPRIGSGREWNGHIRMPPKSGNPKADI